VTSPENNEVRKHRAHWSPSLVREAGREWTRQEPSDIDEARRVSSRERANQSNQRVGRRRARHSDSPLFDSITIK
jgi:hypothetical protein